MGSTDSAGPSIPAEPGLVTAEWLTTALTATFPDIEVAGVEVLDQHSGTTGRLRLGLTHGPGSTGPATVFVKMAPFDDGQRRLVAATDMGRREARFYEGPAAEAPVLLPRPYHAAHGDDPSQYVMVLEDLVGAGCTFADGAHSDTAEHNQQLIEVLAGLHARFWNDERFAGELRWVPPAMRGALGAQLIDNARHMFGTEMPPVFTELCRLYSEHHEPVCDLWDEGEQTLIHGDTHTGNQFVREGRVGLYDWAVISRSPGIRDVAIHLGNSCPTDLRRQHEQRWVSAYHRALVEAGVDAPSCDTLWQRYRRAVLYAWVAATATASMGSTWQPVAVGMAAMERATTACADLETVEAVREAL
ncbi:MAG: ecdysteroid 22-kinase family protein [Acidimicrobiia bacterium]|nr:ecdysteroid 22-kinase family protein [Acidimicrobiia bacterium]